MKNRDSNENIYRNLEKCYALLQVHILFSFHTLLYILLITHRKVRKIIGENRRISEKIGENQRKSGKIGEFPRKMHGKSGNFRGIHSSKWQNRRKILRSFPVISGHFRSFSVVFPVIPGYDSEWFRMIPQNHSVWFRLIPFHSSTPRFYALKHKKVIYFKISSIFFWRFQIFFVLLPTSTRW